MNYIYIEGEKQPRASHVNLKGSKLEFSCETGKSCLVVQSEFGKDLDIKALVKEMEESQRDIQQFEQFSHPTEKSLYRVRYVSPQMIALVGGVDIIERGCRYTMIVVDIKDDEARLYQPNTDVIYPNYLDVRYVITVQIVKHSEIEVRKEKGGFLCFKKKVETERVFHEIVFQEDYSNLCAEGDIYYHIGNSRNIPISKAVLSHRNFYIKSDLKPEMETGNQGLSLNIKG